MTTQKGQVDPSKKKGGPVTTAGIVVLVLAIIAGLVAAGVALYCVFRIRKIRDHEAITNKMKGNLLDQDEETFDAHEI